MPVISSAIDVNSAEFTANAAAMARLVETLKANAATVADGGGARYAERHKARGKLLARERIERLVDPGAPFLEIGAFAAWEMYSGDIASAGVVAGIGRRCWQRLRDRRQRSHRQRRAPTFR